MDFIQSDTFSQIVMSESVATCWANNLAKSKLGKLNIDTPRLNKLFGKTDLKWDTTTLAEHIPLFEEHYGADSEMELNVHFTNLNVIFGQYDSDIIIEGEAIMEIINLGGGISKGLMTLMKDKQSFIATMDLQTKDDIMYFDLLNVRLDVDYENFEDIHYENHAKHFG